MKKTTLGAALLAATILLAGILAAPTAAEAQTLGCAANGLTPEAGINFGTSLDSAETWEFIVGDPLIIGVGSTGGIALWVCQPSPQNISRQYFSEDAWRSVVFLDGTNPSSAYYTGYVATGTRTTGSAHTLEHVGDVWTARTEMALGSGATLTRVVTYVDEAYSFRTRWELTNTSGAAYDDVRFLHGGDTYFGGDDSARSWWNEDLNMVYVNNSQFLTSGVMSFRGSPATPADRYYGGSYSSGNSFASAGELPNTTNSGYVDAGFYLQWNRASLAPGATWTIEAFEAWTDPTYIQVLAPSDALAIEGATVPLLFSVHNLDSEEHTFDLTTETDVGWTATLVGGSSITVPGLTETPVTVQVAVPAGTPPDVRELVSLSARDPIAGSEGTSSTSVTVFDPDFSFSITSLDFGDVAIGATERMTVTLSNSGSAVEVATIGGSDGLAGPFSIASDTCSGETLSNGESCQVQVDFAPTAAGPATDSFNFPIVAPLTTSQSIAVSGSTIPACDDGVANGSESDVDCGGTCAACADGGSCSASGDCGSGVCAGGVCAVPTCSDTVQNGSETDDDCGGACDRCADGGSCSASGDCGSGVCEGGVCAVPTCSDTVQNGSETDGDCGGSCGACVDGAGCGVAGDCTSSVCAGGTCVAARCDDSVRNGTEADVDCGGDDCGACVDGAMCAAPGDCVSGVCVEGACQVSTCDDMVRNGDESDADCGGSCADCEDGAVCGEAGDCVSGVCTSGMCVAATCVDDVENRTETDVDCGGDCAPCADGASCTGPGDCVSSVCDDGTCAVPSCEDGARNAEETDTDCGAGCDACAAGRACDVPADCLSGVCDDAICVAAGCDDGLQNGDETDLDCGGSCGGCDDASACVDEADCRSAVCVMGLCQAPTCDDAVANGQETDLDCGGDCAPCADGAACGLPGDCASGVCPDGRCEPETCTDRVKNGDEPDMDCGGSCGACETGARCGVNADCQSRVCAWDACAAPSCEDGTHNGDESGRDCGGSCDGCGAGEVCASNADCAEGSCSDGVCATSTGEATGIFSGGSATCSASAGHGSSGPSLLITMLAGLFFWRRRGAA